MSESDDKIFYFMRILLAFCFVFYAISVDAQIAYDEASNYQWNWTSGSNQGNGFGNWSLTAGANSGSFIGEPWSSGISMNTTDAVAFANVS